ncbi:ArsR/SmtB family transcription factor [Fodinicola feengrottensis]|uniref:HTH arsR-type domain-containing protein n=1 Tax=Fodinicola feengrottensis TaxID=435914 RepID=A0ABN2JCU9_9ACTN|nr:metalloregulator ArsR/SmtB family transcription factor [Fodinicola feengrottensis]
MSVQAQSTPTKSSGETGTYHHFAAAGELLRSLAAPIRIAIVTELSAGPLCVHELVAALGAPQPLVSQHLRVLRVAKLVTTERRGREIAYALTDQHVAQIVADAVSHAGEVR